MEDGLVLDAATVCPIQVGESSPAQRSYDFLQPCLDFRRAQACADQHVRIPCGADPSPGRKGSPADERVPNSSRVESVCRRFEQGEEAFTEHLRLP